MLQTTTDAPSTPASVRAPTVGRGVSGNTGKAARAGKLRWRRWLYAGLALTVLTGAIGVMSIMLASVTERTREIGIRMATGARTANILQQFIAEAVVVSVIGGLIGVTGELAVAATLAAFDTPILFSIGPVLLAFGCAFGTALIFGYMPAHKAAKLDPVVALGAE